MSASLEDWVLLAHIVRPQGRNGEVLADLFTDFPQLFPQRKGLCLRPPSGSALEAVHEARVDSHWLHKGRVVLKFNQVNSIDEAERLRGFDLVVPREERIPLEGDAVYVSDLIGMKIIDVNGGGAVEAGEITDVEPEGAGPALLVVRSPVGEELLIPFVRAYLRATDIEGKLLEMDLPRGLLNLQARGAEDAE
jgi:16S rRNA processing protein RimM